PPSMITYLKQYWIDNNKIKSYWSAIYRLDRTILEECDTNMLLEAWHHLLKGNFAEGKRNQRLDHLIHLLVVVSMHHFIHRHTRQAAGFEGPNLEAAARMEVQRRA
ncbi:hypothetical protein ARMSODRAFT_852105, partial [Armillaria solidipes]